MQTRCPPLKEVIRGQNRGGGHGGWWREGRDDERLCGRSSDVYACSDHKTWLRSECRTRGAKPRLIFKTSASTWHCAFCCSQVAAQWALVERDRKDRLEKTITTGTGLKTNTQFMHLRLFDGVPSCEPLHKCTCLLWLHGPAHMVLMLDDFISILLVWLQLQEPLTFSRCRLTWTLKKQSQNETFMSAEQLKPSLRELMTEKLSRKRCSFTTVSRLANFRSLPLVVNRR